MGRNGGEAMFVATKTKTYFCSFEGCGMTFDRPSRLQWHFRNHTGERPYKCQEAGCLKTYATSTKLKRHQKTFHKSNDFNLLCLENSAAKTCPEIDTHNIHDGNTRTLPAVEKADHTESQLIDKDSADKVYNYKCLEVDCGKSFKRRANLYNHKVMQHEKRANHRCAVEGCDKVFTFPNLLKRHTKSHQGYTCKQCLTVFYKWSDMRKHVSAEHKKVHSCSSCSKTFKRPCDLHRHELTHSGRKQIYACTLEGCPKSYDRVATLRKHIKAQHQGELPYKCDVCVAAFPHAADLRRHVKYHERIETDVKKSYPAKGHRRVALVNRLAGTLPASAPLPPSAELPPYTLPASALSTTDNLTISTHASHTISMDTHISL